MKRRHFAFVALLVATIGALSIGHAFPDGRASALATPIASPIGASPTAGPAPTRNAVTAEASPAAGLLATVQANQTATAQARATATAATDETATAQATETAVAVAASTSAVQTAVVDAATQAAGIAATATAYVANADATIAALTSENTDLEATLVGLATSQAEADQAAHEARDTGAALSTQVADLEATINAEPTSTATAVPTPTNTPEPTQTPLPTDTPAPTSTPTPTPTPPPSGTVLYEANSAGGFEGWELSGGWQYFDGMLVNDGSGGTLVIPHQPSVANYAVEAEILYLSGANAYFGLSAWGGAVGAGIYPSGGGTDFLVIYLDGENIGEGDNPTNREWVTYRLEVEGNEARLSIGGVTAIEETDNRLLANGGGSAGLFSEEGIQVNVRSFKVIAL